MPICNQTTTDAQSRCPRRYYFVDAPGLFVEYHLPIDRDDWNEQDTICWQMLERLAAIYRTVICRSSFRQEAYRARKGYKSGHPPDYNC